jgi:hypothetical protein
LYSASCSSGERRERREEPCSAPSKSAARAAHLAHQRQHGAQHLAHGRDVVLRDPLGQIEQLLGQDGIFIENADERFGFDRRRIVMHAQHDAGQLLIAKGHQHTGANGRSDVCERVGKGAVERNGQGYIAEGRH